MFFKAYAILSVFLTILNDYIIIKNYTYDWSDLTNTILTWIAVIGVFSFAFKKKILRPKFWKYYLIIFLSYEVIYMFWISRVKLTESNMMETYWFTIVFNFVIGSPLYYSIYKLQKMDS